MKKLILGALVMFFAMIALANAQSTDYSLSASGWTNGPAGTATKTGTQTIQAGTNAWAISPYTGSTMVGLTPTSPTATYTNMTTALDMSAASVSALSGEIAAQNPQGGGNITNAAWVYKDFPLAAATKFSMYWVYTSTDYVPFNDGSITTFVNTGNATALGKINNVLTQYILLGATNPGTGNYSTGSYGSTGWQIVNYEAVDAGTYRLGFAAFNQGDTALSPVLYVNDGLGTVTKNGQTFGAVAPNDPNMPTVDPTPTPSNPTVVSTTPTDPNVVTNTTYGTPAPAPSLVMLSSTNTGSMFNVSKITTPVIATPYTITTVSTPQVIQTWSDNTTTTVADPNNSGTTTTQNGTTYQFGSSDTQNAKASSVGLKEAIAFKNNNLFVVDALTQKDGSWIAPFYSYSKATGSNKSNGVSLGYQKTVDNNTAGFALQYAAGDSNGYLNSKTDNTTYTGLGYILTKQEYAWLKGTFGVSGSEYNNTTSLPLFSLFNQGKVKQNNIYADATVYSPKDFNGFRPLFGLTVNRSEITDSKEMGSALLSSAPNKGVTTRVNPYIGLRYDIDKNVGIETRVTQTKDFKTVVGVRGTVSKEVYKNVYVNASVGVDKGRNYSNITGMIGLKVIF
jgi:hypothetical protein